jgi:hypothetical protein
LQQRWILILEFFIRKVESTSGLFANANDSKNPKIEIEISGTNEDGKEIPKHLIITGVNGTGKTLLLDDIHYEIRKLFSKTHYVIENKKRYDGIDTNLTFCEHRPDYTEPIVVNCKDKIAYFEPLVINSDHMFKPSHMNFNYNDYSELLILLAKKSVFLCGKVKEGLRSLYDNFDRLGFENGSNKNDDKDTGKDTEIILNGRDTPLKVEYMPSGHYSFFNTYCRILFSKFALVWENKSLWENIKPCFDKCLEISEKIPTIIDAIDEEGRKLGKTNVRDTETASGAAKEIINKIKNCCTIANDRLGTFENENASRSRVRDREIALKSYQSKQLMGALNKLCDKKDEAKKEEHLYSLLEKLDSHLNDFENILDKCLDELLDADIKEESCPLIIIIDEPEMHLHVSLQRKVIPYLAGNFDNVQFIIATHSPFVVTSLPNATLFNMENREILNENLTLYSYENIVEGWFGISLCTDETKEQFIKFEEKAKRDEKLVGDDKEEYIELYRQLIKTDFINSVSRLNLRKELKDGEIYVLH